MPGSSPRFPQKLFVEMTITIDSVVSIYWIRYAIVGKIICHLSLGQYARNSEHNLHLSLYKLHVSFNYKKKKQILLKTLFHFLIFCYIKFKSSRTEVIFVPASPSDVTLDTVIITIDRTILVISRHTTPASVSASEDLEPIRLWTERPSFPGGWSCGLVPHV